MWLYTLAAANSGLFILVPVGIVLSFSRVLLFRLFGRCVSAVGLV